MGGTSILTDMWVRGTERAAKVADRFAGLYESIEAAAFWASIVFPVGYVPFLTGGIRSSERAVAFAGLVAIHFMLLTLGHAHGR